MRIGVVQYYGMGDFLKLFFGVVVMPLVFIVALVMLYLVFNVMGVSPEPVISILVLLSPLWLPYVLFHLLFERWLEYVRLKWVIKSKRFTLRVKLPQEVFKSPEAMESVFSGLYSGGAGENLMETYLDGVQPYTLSFELVSHGGEVRFYINVPGKKVKNTVEALLYAQYPGIEVVEEDLDYASEVSWNPSKYEMLSFHIVKKENQIYPIKTYIDFGLDKLPKEEEKFEPMAALVGQLGRAKPTQRVWIQILVKGHGKKSILTGNLQNEGTWQGDIEAKISEMLLRDKQKQGIGETELQPRLSKGEQDLIAAMERNVGKFAFETAIRMMIIAPKKDFETDLITPIMRSFAQYEILKRNGLGVRWRSNYDYNWFSDWSGKKRLNWKKKELADYKKRKYEVRSYPGKDDAMKIMSSEELATIYHIPGSSVTSPSLPRILSTRKEAPPNLPTGLPTSL